MGIATLPPAGSAVGPWAPNAQPAATPSASDGPADDGDVFTRAAGAPAGVSFTDGPSGLPGPVQWAVHEIGRLVGPIMEHSRRTTRDPEIVKSLKADGCFLGADGVLPPSTPVASIHGVVPDPGKELTGGPTEPLFYINGIGTPVQRMFDNDLKAVANCLGSEVIAIYRADQGFGNDVAEMVGDWAGAGDDAATDTAARVIFEKLMDGKSMRLMCDSGGGATTARAIREAARRMKAAGLSNAEVVTRLGRLTVFTMGVAERLWPDGPAYYHYVNRKDPTARFLGPISLLAEPGQGAHLMEFSTGPLSNPWSWDHNHSFDAYFPWIEEDARRVEGLAADGSGNGRGTYGSGAPMGATGP